MRVSGNHMLKFIIYLWWERVGSRIKIRKKIEIDSKQISVPSGNTTIISDPRVLDEVKYNKIVIRK